MLERLDLAQPHPHGKTRILADGGLGLGSAAGAGFLQGALDNRLEV
jgi:hypothetical protein